MTGQLQFRVPLRVRTLLVRRPLFWMLLVVAAVAATALAGVVLGVAAMSSAAGLTVFAAHRPRVRAYLEDSARTSAWRSRRDARETRLEDAGVVVDGLRDATRIVGELGSATLKHFELEALLDHFVDVAIWGKRCERALDQTERGTMAKWSSSSGVVEQRTSATRPARRCADLGRGGSLASSRRARPACELARSVALAFVLRNDRCN
jgi:hypothetical protein